METLNQILLALHVGGGTAALVAGLLAILLRKWSTAHKRAGTVFYYSTLLLSLAALWLSATKGNSFLLHIGLFTFYQNQAGYRSVRDKSLRPSRFDYLVFAIAGINSLFMLASAKLVLMVFGAINLSLVLQDAVLYYNFYRGRKPKAKAWLLRHLGMMLGTYIAIFTAFLVVNFTGGFWLWLLPTFVFTPVIIVLSAGIGSGRLQIVPRKRLKTAAVLLLLAAGVLGSQATQAQVYVEGGKTRHRFAQLTLGMSARYMPTQSGASWQRQADGSLRSADLPAQLVPRFVIGGTHFWGHADFLVAFPLLPSGPGGYSEGVETSFRYMPWQLRDRKLRPYLGLSHMAVQLQRDGGAKVQKHLLPLSAGLYWLRGNHLFELGMSWNAAPGIDYYHAPQLRATSQLPPLALQLGYKWMIETTLSAEPRWQNGRTAYLTDTLGKLNRLDAWTFGIGPSAGFFMAKSPFLADEAAWLGQHRGGTMLELMVGRYQYRHDLQMSLLYRGMRSTVEGHGSRQALRRQSLAVEAYHFFADYHGFTPFVGPVLSYEAWSANTQLLGQAPDARRYTALRPGITFGWDIRPDQLQRWYLRTSLRYFPGMDMGMGEGSRMRLDQLEVNFIQLVLMPGRFC